MLPALKKEILGNFRIYKHTILLTSIFLNGKVHTKSGVHTAEGLTTANQTAKSHLAHVS